MTQDETQDTRETPALGANGGEIKFTRAAAEGIGDPAAAGTDAVGDDSAPVEPAGDSPADAQARAESHDASPVERPEVQILGAFVGAFVLAKVLQKLFGKD